MKNIQSKKNKRELKTLKTRMECLNMIRKYTAKFAQTFKPKKGMGSYTRKNQKELE